MGTIDPDRVRELFGRAVDLDEDEREAFLDRECGADDALKAEILALLRHAGDEPPILRTGAPIELPLDEAPPGRVGPFRIVREVARGGMGVVYLAEQDAPVRRRVAIKLMRHVIGAPDVVTRFESERQALALMDHPNIARVIDAGADETGRPYFAMDFIDGVPVNRYCDEARLTVPQRLDLFLQICAGIQHAHQKAVIHRDIKPSNVIVATHDGQPTPMIIDFGIAKALGRPLAGHAETRIGQLLGTLEYMSPEQANPGPSGVDTRADVYSLGALLYELLTGRPPIAPDELHDVGLEEIARRIREVDPPRPSMLATRAGGNDAIAERRDATPASLERLLRGDLDLIVMKALEKERDRRYASVSEMADDIRRYLRHEPVRASPPSLTYGARKFVRRHWVSVTIAALVTTFAVAYGATMSLLNARVSREAAAAERALELAIDLVWLGETGPIVYNENARRGLVRSDALVEQLVDRPLVQAELRTALGRRYTYAGMFDEARQTLTNALGQLRELAGEDDPATLRVRISLARLDQRLGRYPESLATLREVVERQSRTLPENDFDRMDGRIALATAITFTERDDSAATDLAEVLEVAEREIGADHNLTLDGLETLSIAYYMADRLEETVHAMNELYERRIRANGPQGLETLVAMGNLAKVNGQLGRFDEAERLYADVLTARRCALGPSHRATLATMQSMACLAALQGDRAAALGHLREAVDNGLTDMRLLEDSELELLFGDPGYEALLRRVRESTAAASAPPTS